MNLYFSWEQKEASTGTSYSFKILHSFKKKQGKNKHIISWEEKKKNVVLNTTSLGVFFWCQTAKLK